MTHALNDTTHAYRDLKAFDHFVGEAFESRHYVPVPSDWLILVADIVCSTEAVAGGQYEEVNYVGAGCVLALTQALEDTPIPTVFGGDGALAAIPPVYRDDAVEVLYAMRQWAGDAFSLDLRIGLIPMTELERRGATLNMGKMQLGVANEIAMFRGTAIELADELVKLDEDYEFRLPDRSDDDASSDKPDLTDLSCRWSPIAPERDLMLCLIIGVRDPLNKTEEQIDMIYREVVDQVDRVVAIEDPDSSPVKKSNLDFKLRLQSLTKEIKARPGNIIGRTVAVVGFNLIAKALFSFNLSAGWFRPDQYVRDIPVNTDFVKVSGMVRLVVDCSDAQSQEVEKVLEAEYEKGEIVFGLHRAKQALMTCVTPDIENGKHLHYIDASEGGFWSAASDLKRRIVDTNA